VPVPAAGAAVVLQRLVRDRAVPAVITAPSRRRCLWA
jgi:hypothetical protein